MDPLEAYESVMRFAADRGEPALRLALHAAVPQSFRPDFLHLLRLNFVSEASPETEADVLLAPFCVSIGGGYYQLDPEARRLLLDELDPTYPEESVNEVTRVQRVADFLATYIENERRRLSASVDRLAEDYLAIQGWVALAFLRPETAAAQLAAALDQGIDGEVAARVQFSGLASALSVPLVHYPKLLTYAAGIEAMEQGRTDAAASLLERLPDEEIRIGSVTLRSPRKLLTPRDHPREEREQEEQRTENAAPSRYGSCFISYPHPNRDFVEWLRPALKVRGVQVWTAPDDLKEDEEEGQRKYSAVTEAIQSSDTFLLVLSKSFRSSKGARWEVDLAERSGRLIISLMVDPPQEVLGKDVPVTTAIDFSQPENREKSLRTLLELLEAYTGAAPEAAPEAEEPTPPEAPVDPEPVEAEAGLVYLSYAREDSDMGMRLSKELAWAGVRVERDWGLAESEDGEEDAWHLERSIVFVALLSRHTLESSREARGERLSPIEREKAAKIIHQRGPSGLMILPVVLDDTNLMEAGLPDIFYRTDWFHLRNDEDRRRLVEVIGGIVREKDRSHRSQPA